MYSLQLLSQLGLIGLCVNFIIQLIKYWPLAQSNLALHSPTTELPCWQQHTPIQQQSIGNWRDICTHKLILGDATKGCRVAWNSPGKGGGGSGGTLPERIWTFIVFVQRKWLLFIDIYFCQDYLISGWFQLKIIKHYIGKSIIWCTIINFHFKQ